MRNHKRKKLNLKVPITAEKKSSQLSRDTQGGTAGSSVFAHICVCWGWQMQNKKGVSNTTIAKCNAPGLGVIFPLHCTSTTVKNKHTEWFCKKGVNFLWSRSVSPPSRAQHATVQAHLLQPAGTSRDQPLPLRLFGQEIRRPQDRSSRLAQNQAKWVAQVHIAKAPLETSAKIKAIEEVPVCFVSRNTLNFWL